MGLNQLAGLLLREFHRVFKEGAVRFQDELNHAFWILAADTSQYELICYHRKHGVNESDREQQWIDSYRRRL
jgi:hypothetical protein